MATAKEMGGQIFNLWRAKRVLAAVEDNAECMHLP
jgi:hypothetical protein